MKMIFPDQQHWFKILSQLTVIPTSIVQQFVEHYEKREKLVELEACITHLHIMCLDIHQGPQFIT